MIKTILQSIGSVLLSLVVTLVLLSLIELAGAALYPFPEGIELTREVVEQQVATTPAWLIFLLGVVGWGLTMLVACWLATRYGAGRHPAHGIGIGVLLLAAAAFNIYSLPYPVWYVFMAVVILPLAAYFGVTLARARAG